MRIVILGLSITSSWGNGHATTYRSLVRAMVKRGHEVLFLERDVPWYATNRDLPNPPYGTTKLYRSLADLKRRFTGRVRSADLVVVGSYVPEGVAVGEWAIATAQGVSAFYDIDTPVTLAKLQRGETEYLSRSLAPKYDLYFSFTGGPTLSTLRSKYRVARPRVLYCSVDPELYSPKPSQISWDLGYLGTYSDDRQPTLERLLLDTARRQPQRRFAVAGPLYPASIEWPANVERIEHLPPAEHRRFYNSQRFTLNVTRGDMLQAGYSPSVRLFEAAACGTPIISDVWAGLEEVLSPGKEVLLANSDSQVLEYLTDIPEKQRIAIGAAGRARILREHTADHRALELEEHVLELVDRPRRDAARDAIPAT